jgi:hypothetical protein
MQVDDEFVIRGPAEGDVVALLDPNDPLIRGQKTLADWEVNEAGLRRGLRWDEERKDEHQLEAWSHHGSPFF